MGFKLLKFVALSLALTQLARTQIVPVPTFPPLPSPVTSGFTQKDLDSRKFPNSLKSNVCFLADASSVWQVVEKGNPVVRPNITRVLDPIANFSVGPEPPRFRPAYLQATTKDLKLPKGFLYGVATSATQFEGAVKEGGRGPR